MLVDDRDEGVLQSKLVYLSSAHAYSNMQPQPALQAWPRACAPTVVTLSLLQPLLLQIKESLVRFGVSPECRHLLVARFNSNLADVRGASARMHYVGPA
jgi:hypothetical protein